MAIQDCIGQLNHFGIPATLELPSGKWCHSEEYLALRAGGIAALVRCLKRKIIEGSERAKLQLALVKGDPSILIEQQQGAEHGDEE